jgi:hypothetical protein
MGDVFMNTGLCKGSDTQSPSWERPNTHNGSEVIRSSDERLRVAENSGVGGQRRKGCLPVGDSFPDLGNLLP